MSQQRVIRMFANLHKAVGTKRIAFHGLAWAACLYTYHIIIMGGSREGNNNGKGYSKDWGKRNDILPTA